MRRFIDTLTRLPNLRRLELLSVSHRGPITRALKRKSAKFPNIHEVLIDSKYPDFVISCPNLESISKHASYFFLHNTTFSYFSYFFSLLFFTYYFRPLLITFVFYFLLFFRLVVAYYLDLKQRPFLMLRSLRTDISYLHRLLLTWIIYYFNGWVKSVRKRMSEIK